MKALSDGIIAMVGMKVQILKSDSLKVGTITNITSIEGKVINKNRHIIDLSKWKDIVQVSDGWLVNVNNLKII